MLLAADSGSLETLAAELCREGLPPPRVRLLLKRVWQLGTASEHTRTPSVSPLSLRATSPKPPKPNSAES